METDQILSIFITFIAALFGGVITWIVSKRYYKKASKDLLTETQKMMHIMKYIAIFEKDESGQYTLKLDDKGLITGLNGSLKGSSSFKMVCEGKLKAKTEED